MYLKQYADNSLVSYYYTDDGKLDTRTWARHPNDDPVCTTYTYDEDTGELTNIDYSIDGNPDPDTPDVEFGIKGDILLCC